jgi:hypothetical protein
MSQPYSIHMQRQLQVMIHAGLGTVQVMLHSVLMKYQDGHAIILSTPISSKLQKIKLPKFGLGQQVSAYFAIFFKK